MATAVKEMFNGPTISWGKIAGLKGPYKGGHSTKTTAATAATTAATAATNEAQC